MPKGHCAAGAVVASNHVLGRSRDAPSTRSGGTPPRCTASSDRCGECTHARSGCAAKSPPTTSMTSLRRSPCRRAVMEAIFSLSPQVGHGHCGESYLGVGNQPAELAAVQRGGKDCGSGKSRSGASMIGHRPRAKSSPGIRRRPLGKKSDERQPLPCRSATCRANISGIITSGRPLGWTFRGKSSLPVKCLGTVIFLPWITPSTDICVDMTRSGVGSNAPVMESSSGIPPAILLILNSCRSITAK